MKIINCKNNWVHAGGARYIPPTPKQVQDAKKWVKDNLMFNKDRATSFMLRMLIQYRMQRVLKLWAYNAIPTHRGGDAFFDKQGFLSNKQSAKNRSDLMAECVGGWLSENISRQIRQGNDTLAFARAINAIDKEIDYTLGMICRAKNSYPNLGEKLMYEAVVELSKLTNSVYNYYAPNIK